MQIQLFYAKAFWNIFYDFILEWWGIYILKFKEYRQKQRNVTHLLQELLT